VPDRIIGLLHGTATPFACVTGSDLSTTDELAQALVLGDRQ
jgi:hypothetical protein